MRIKVTPRDQSRAAPIIKENRTKAEVTEASKAKRVIPVTMLAIYKWPDGFEVRGKDKTSTVAIECETLDEALAYVKDNL